MPVQDNKQSRLADIESPFLDGELFQRETPLKRPPRLNMFEAESPFQQAFEPGQAEFLHEETIETPKQEGFESGFLTGEEETLLDEGALETEELDTTAEDALPGPTEFEPEEEPDTSTEREMEEADEEHQAFFDEPKMGELDAEAALSLESTPAMVSEHNWKLWPPPIKSLKEPLKVLNVPFADPPPAGSYWPIRTSRQEGRLVSYTAVDGSIIPRGGRSRMFLANRDTGKRPRWHVGVDLFANKGDVVVACEDGKVVNAYPYYKAKSGQMTWCLLIEHSKVVVNYGEVTEASLNKYGTRKGMRVRAGQPIAAVSDTSMLHFETFAKGTIKNVRWWKDRDRPSALLNPTRYLLFLQEHGLPQQVPGEGESYASSEGEMEEEFEESCTEPVLLRGESYASSEGEMEEEPEEEAFFDEALEYTDPSTHLEYSNRPELEEALECEIDEGSYGSPLPGEAEWEVSSFSPVAVENPGGERIRDKRDPNKTDIVYVQGTNGAVPLHRLAAAAWQALVAEARSAGIQAPLLLPISGYRSREHQARLWQDALQKYGSASAARRLVAPPGGSAHQSGRAIDFYLGSKNTSKNVAHLQSLPAYRWLAANAQRFGFYPYPAEPWHWEYNPPGTTAPPPTMQPPFELSGPAWVARFPTSSSTADLLPAFRAKVDRFIAALRAAGVHEDSQGDPNIPATRAADAYAGHLRISATYRPIERAYLMHYSFLIARRGLDPRTVPPMANVNIRWVHEDSQGNPDIPASRAAAKQMVIAYGIVYAPALTSRHTQRRAIDMTITWKGNLVITDATGQQITITSTPRTGAGNHDLWRVGASYGVIKLPSDAPHWSDDGH